MITRAYVSLVGFLLFMVCTVSLGQAQETTCADVLTSLGGENGGSEAPALWGIPTLSLVKLLTSYGVDATPRTISLSDGEEIEPMWVASCYGSYLFTNEADADHQNVWLNVYDVLLKKRLVSLETFGLPTEVWLIGDVVAANLFAYSDSGSIIFSIETQKVLDTSSGVFDERKIIMVSGQKLLRENTWTIGGPPGRAIESLAVAGDHLQELASCRVDIPELGDNLPELEYTLRGSDLIAIPASAPKSSYVVETCSDAVSTFLNSSE